MTEVSLAKEAYPVSSQAELELTLHQAHQTFGNRANFRGIDIGYRWQNGQPTDDICLRIHVDRKVPTDALMKSQIFPAELNGFQLDVIAATYQPSLEPGTARSAAARQPYTMGGLSCGRHGEGTGTIGLVVIDRTTGKPGILSNWHVLAGPRARRNDPITQPGGLDGGFDPRDRIARLKRWLLDRGGDAAYAELLPDQPWLPLQFGTFNKVTKTASAKLGEILTKSGRSGASRQARVDGLGIYRVPYETRPGLYEYRDVEGFRLVPVPEDTEADNCVSSAGDSGAAWVSTDSAAAVGLQFGEQIAADPRHNAAPQSAIACNLETVLEKMNLRLAEFTDLMEQNNQEPILTAYQQRQANLSSTAETSSPDWPHPMHWPDHRYQPASLEGRPDRIDRQSQRGEIVPLVRISPNRGVASQYQDGQGHALPNINIPQDIWLLRLYPALLDYDTNFRGAFLDEPVAQRISAADSRSIHAFFAHLINGTRHFDGIGLKQMREADFEGVVTYMQVCERIAVLLSQR